MNESLQHHWLRQSNLSEASQLQHLLGEQPGALSVDEHAARLLGAMQRMGLSINGDSLRHWAQLANPPSDIAALRDLARAHAARQSTTQQREATTTLIQISRDRTIPADARPARPAQGEPITLIDAFVERGAQGEVLNLAGKDLRHVPDLARQINVVQRSRNPLLIDVSDADMRGVSLQGVNLSRANLSGARLSGANLSNANLHAANVRGADLSHADLTSAQLSANFDGANLKGADLSDAIANEGSFIGTTLSEATLLRASLYRADLSRANLVQTDLTEAHLHGAQLTSAVLEGAVLDQANLYRADLEHAHMAGANLSGANLTEANLAGTNLSAADLSRANLTNANLQGANLTRAEVGSAIMRGTRLDGTIQLGVDWSGAIDVGGAARGTPAPVIRPGDSPRVTPAQNSLADPAAQRQVVRDLMARYGAPVHVRTEKMETLILAEVDRARERELSLFQYERQPPADVVEGLSSEVEFLGRAASLGNYLRYLRQKPERFQPIANRTLYAEAQYLELASQAGNGGVLRAPQLEAIGRESDPSRQAYLTHRALSDALSALDAAWSDVLAGREPTRPVATFGDSMEFLSDKSVSPDDRYTERPSDASNERLAQLMQKEWGRKLPLDSRGESERRTIFTKARVLDRASSIEVRLSMMNQTSRDQEFLQSSLRSLDVLISEMQSMAADSQSFFSELRPFEARQARDNLLLPLRATIERLLQAP
jgi:uncharacterized protein YjbI with pentapeptide repeats